MDALLFKKLLKQEQKALACAWEAFLSIQKEGKVPYPVHYSQVFTRIQSQKEFEEPELFSILKESRGFLDHLLKELAYKYQKTKDMTLRFKPEDIYQIDYLRKRIEKLEAEIQFLKEEVLIDPLTKFWNQRGLQKIFDYAVKQHIYSEDYALIIFYILMPKEKELLLYEDKIILASAKFITNFFSPRDFLTRPSTRLFAIISVGQTIPALENFIQTLSAKNFPCKLGSRRHFIEYKIGGTNILGADHLNVVLERAMTAAQQNRFFRV